MTGKEKDNITKLSPEHIDQIKEEGKIEEKSLILKPDPDLIIFSDINNKEAKQSFYKKLCEIQAEEIVVEKNMYMEYKNYHYANLDDILKAYKPLLSKNKILLINSIDIEKLILTTKIIDIENPEIYEKSTWKIFWKNSQDLGASITYWKRYNISALLNVATGEDFDGNSPEQIEKTAEDGYYQPKKEDKPTAKKPAAKPVANTPKKTTPVKVNVAAKTPEVEAAPVPVKKKVFWISEKQLAFASDLYDKYTDKKGAEAWTLEKILSEKYSGKTLLKDLTGIQAKDFIDEMLKRV